MNEGAAVTVRPGPETMLEADDDRPDEPPLPETDFFADAVPGAPRRPFKDDGVRIGMG